MYTYMHAYMSAGRPEGNNPYSDFDIAHKWMAHVVFVLRTINLVVLLPAIETLFFRYVKHCS